MSTAVGGDGGDEGSISIVPVSVQMMVSGILPKAGARAWPVPLDPPRRQAYWKVNFLHDLPDEAIEIFHHYALTAPSPYTTGPWLECVHGAISRVGPSETAFARRRHPFNFLVLSSWTEASEAEPNITWRRECWDAVCAFMAPVPTSITWKRKPIPESAPPTGSTMIGLPR